MYIRDLSGWPPPRFQSTTIHGACPPEVVSRMVLQEASLVPRIGPRDAPELFLLFRDPATDLTCSARFMIADGGVAVRVVKTLADARDRTLDQIAALEIRSEDGAN